MEKLPPRPIITEVRQQRHHIRIKLALIAKSRTKYGIDYRLQHLLSENNDRPDNLSVGRWSLRANISRVNLTKAT
jgi:hypothetical protein